jgi:hypothetical protein
VGPLTCNAAQWGQKQLCLPLRYTFCSAAVTTLLLVIVMGLQTVVVVRLSSATGMLHKFTSEFCQWQGVFDILGTKLSLLTAYHHPQTNGLAERTIGRFTLGCWNIFKPIFNTLNASNFMKFLHLCIWTIWKIWIKLNYEWKFDDQCHEIFTPLYLDNLEDLDQVEFGVKIGWQVS